MEVDHVTNAIEFAQNKADEINEHALGLIEFLEKEGCSASDDERALMEIQIVKMFSYRNDFLSIKNMLENETNMI